MYCREQSRIADHKSTSPHVMSHLETLTDRNKNMGQNTPVVPRRGAWGLLTLVVRVSVLGIWDGSFQTEASFYLSLLAQRH